MDLEDKEIGDMMSRGEKNSVFEKIRNDLSSLGGDPKFFSTPNSIYYYDPNYEVISGKRGGVTKFQFSGRPGKWQYNFIYSSNNDKDKIKDKVIVSKNFGSYGEVVKSIIEYVDKHLKPKSSKKVGSLVSYYRELIGQ